MSIQSRLSSAQLSSVAARPLRTTASTSLSRPPETDALKPPVPRLASPPSITYGCSSRPATTFRRLRRPAPTGFQSSRRAPTPARLQTRSILFWSSLRGPPRRTSPSEVATRSAKERAYCLASHLSRPFTAYLYTLLPSTCPRWHKAWMSKRPCNLFSPFSSRTLPFHSLLSQARLPLLLPPTTTLAASLPKHLPHREALPRCLLPKVRIGLLGHLLPPSNL